MGVSTNAVLFYGYCWEDEYDLFNPDGASEDDDTEWPERILIARGEVNPWSAFTESTDTDYAVRRAHGDAWTAEHRVELDEWYAKQKAVRDEFNVDIGHHGSDRWSVPYIHIKPSEIISFRGDAKIITPDILIAIPAWDNQLKAFLDTLHIDDDEAKGPAWFLVSWWG